jgi:hypothetical protein
MSAWWWVLIGLAGWLSVSLAVGLLLARFFRHAAQARDALDARAEERLTERQEPPQDGPRVALRAPKRGGAKAPFRVLPGAGSRSAWYQPPDSECAHRSCPRRDTATFLSGDGTSSGLPGGVSSARSQA